MSIQKIIPVILAGGQGTRLWPSSLPHIPKQFITVDGYSLMTRAIERAVALIDTNADERVIVVTSEKYIPLFSEHIEKELRALNIDTKSIVLIGEPEARNTAPAIAFAVKYVAGLYDDGCCDGHCDGMTMMVITADHLIAPIDIFVRDVKRAVEAANIRSDESSSEEGGGNIIMFGITPTYPETGYGYIECGERITDFSQEVKAFTEKPDYDTARSYIETGRFVWNSGMFCFPCAVMERELKQYCNEIDKHILSNSQFSWKEQAGNAFYAVIPQGIDFEELQKISIDYAVMERTKFVGVIRASFDWNDIGSWDEAAELLNNNEHHYLIDAHNNSIKSDMPVGLVGIDDVVVVVENDRVLIMKKGHGQRVSDVAKEDGKQKS